jgi:hypothetical protein
MPESIQIKIQSKIITLLLEDETSIALNAQKVALEEENRNNILRIQSNIDTINSLNEQILAQNIFINNGVFPGNPPVKF